MEPSSYFYLHGGGVLRSVEELLDALKNISDDVLNFHVTPQRNDFSNWSREVLCDKLLSSKLLKAKNREEMIKSVEKRLISIQKAETKKKIINQIKDSHHE